MRIRYSCFMDCANTFYGQTLTWAWSLLELARVSPGDIAVHTVRNSDRGVLQQLASMGIQIEYVEPLFEDNPYCNKLSQLTSPALGWADRVVLCDCDTAFCENIDPWIERCSSVRAKVVDGPNPSMATMYKVFSAAGLADRLEVTPTSCRNGSTFVNNCNGGLYIFHRDTFLAIRDVWLKWAAWTNEQSSILGSSIVHVDQISFALSMTEREEIVDPLPIELNFPTHKNLAAEAELDITPKVLHYHGRVDSDGCLLATGLDNVDKRIRSINAVIKRH